MIGEYLVLGDLGSGASSKVKLAKHSTGGFLCAIKIIKKSQFEKVPDFKSKVYREISLMRLLDHPHILKLIEVCESQNHLYIVLEYAEHGELFSFLVANHALSIDLGMNFFRQLIYGLEYLHEHAICHRDLKPENILLTEMNELKIADFGFARWMKQNIAETSCGSPHYAAPEVIRGTPYDGRAADIWSCGVILFALLSGKLPFFDAVVRNLLAKVKAGKYVMPNFPHPIQNLIAAMLTVDPHARITLEQIKQHPAFRIGYVDASYVLPIPLPMPVLSDPIEFDAIAPPVLNVLRQIGFVDDAELRRDFTSHGNTMAKVFFHMLTKNPLENVPWEAEIRPMTESLIVGAQTISEAEQAKASAGTSSPPTWSPSESEIEWGDVCRTEINGAVVQPYVDIPLPLDVLLAKVQAMLNGFGARWFHPDDFTVVARGPDGTTDLVFIVKRQAPGLLSMDMSISHSTQAALNAITDRLRAALSP